MGMAVQIGYPFQKSYMTRQHLVFLRWFFFLTKNGQTNKMWFPLIFYVKRTFFQECGSVCRRRIDGAAHHPLFLNVPLPPGKCGGVSSKPSFVWETSDAGRHLVPLRPSSGLTKARRPLKLIKPLKGCHKASLASKRARSVCRKGSKYGFEIRRWL